MPPLTIVRHKAMKERGSDHGRSDHAFSTGRINQTVGHRSTPTGSTHRSPNRNHAPNGPGSPKGYYRKLVYALLAGFYLGVTITMWVHALSTADSHLQQNDQGQAMGLIPLHALDWLQNVPSSNCSDMGNNDVPEARMASSSQAVPSSESKAKVKPTATPTKPPVTTRIIETSKELTPKQEKQQHSVDSKIISQLATLPTAQERAQVRQILQKTMQRPFLPLQAVVESPSLSALAGRVNNYTYTKPLPMRTSIQLDTFTYIQNIKSCQDLPDGWPVDHPQEMDSKYGPMVGDLGSLYEKRMKYAEDGCPVDADPFLPWIHDVFSTSDGQYLEFVAHNKRRCRQDPSVYRADIDNLEPQVALLQSVPIQRLSQHQLQSESNIPSDWKTMQSGESRYRLSSIEEADPDGIETRFICHFHTLKPTAEGSVEKVLVGETLSVYPYNYEHANYQHRKGQKPNPMLTRPADESDFKGMHNEQMWNAILHFRCPIPEHLRDTVANGSSVDPSTGIPSLYVDVVPIRTPPREQKEGYNQYHLDVSTFDPEQEWGSMHVLPPVEQSGRWANVPICPPPVKPHSSEVQVKETRNIQDVPATPGYNTKKENYLVGCLWASAAFSTRGEDRLDTSTSHRLLEWLTYHLEVAGFDKMYIYDNSEAFTNFTSLKSVTDLFPDRVERIPWKHRVCNNNRPTHPNAGERSSQYAAEASCRIRYGPTTEWMIAFDTDEYLVPQGKYTSIKDWLKDSVASKAIGRKTNILDFYQIRASINKRFAERYYDNTKECHPSCKSCHCLAKRPNTTFFESFCDPVRFPKPEWTGRAKKQLYRPDFVLNHFVHYAAVTRMIIDEPTLPRVIGYPYERRVKEASEAFMLHTKTKAPRRTKSWKTECLEASTCPVGIPWPYYQEEDVTPVEGTRNEEGYAYNCWESKKIHHDLADRLRKALKPYEDKWAPPNILATSTAVNISNPIREADSVPSKMMTEVDASVGGPVDPSIHDFKPGLPAVIATKIQGNSTLLQLEQALCLLKYAYNDRVNYDIVVFAATSISEDETNILKAAAAPAKLTVAMDNPGLETMVANMEAAELDYLIRRCNVTDVSELTWRTRCSETSSSGTTNMPIQYTWQAEFRSLHIWNHPAISQYKYMMWLDSDGFCTRKWQQDPIATLARNKLAILFDHFPQGQAKGVEWGERFQAAFGKTYCRVDRVDGHLEAYPGDCLGKKLSIKQIHGFFHVTNLDFYRSEAAMKWARIMVGNTKFSRMFDDQIGVTMPAAVLAGEHSWDMRAHGINLGVLHSYKLDGQEQFGGFLNYWKTRGEEAFPEAHGQCKITQHG